MSLARPFSKIAAVVVAVLIASTAHSAAAQETLSFVRQPFSQTAATRKQPTTLLHPNPLPLRHLRPLPAFAAAIGDPHLAVGLDEADSIARLG